MAARILEIVGPRGKMHNPETDSGGVAARHRHRGRGALRVARPRRGERIVTLASLTLTPLRLEVGDAAWIPATRRSRSRHRLRVRPLGLGPGAGRPAARDGARDLRRLRAPARRRARWRLATARCACSAPGMPASWRSPPRATRWRAGRWSPSTSTRTRSSASCELGLCDIGVTTDLRDPLAAIEAVRAAGRAAGRPHGRRGERQQVASRPRSC